MALHTRPQYTSLSSLKLAVASKKPQPKVVTKRLPPDGAYTVKLADDSLVAVKVVAGFVVRVYDSIRLDSVTLQS